MKRLIIDFEATCSDDNTISRYDSEIIEFGCIVVDEDWMPVKDNPEFERFVKPGKNLILTDFCKELTSITQEQIDSADFFDVVFADFKEFVSYHGVSSFSSWGGYDKNILAKECRRKGLDYPFSGHVNLKNDVAKWSKKRLGLGRALRRLGLEFEGTPHRGIDDARNIARVCREVEKITDKKWGSIRVSI